MIRHLEMVPVDIVLLDFNWLKCICSKMNIKNEMFKACKIALLLCGIMVPMHGVCAENSALAKHVSGPLENGVYVTNGIITKDDYTVFKAGESKNAVVVIDLLGPMFTGEIVAFWNKKISQYPHTYHGSIDIFGYKELAKGHVSKTKEGLYAEKITFSPQMVRYVQIDLTENENLKGLQLHEIQILQTPVSEISFTQVHAENIAEHSVEVCWGSDIRTITKIKYGIEKTKMDKMVTQINVDHKHRVQLTGLKKGTDYFYQITVDNITADPFLSEIYSLRTQGIPLPIFSGFSTTIYQDSVAFAWGTNVGTYTLFEIGDSVQLKKKIPLQKKVLNKRSLTVTGLQPGVLYQYKLTCVDTFKNGITSGGRKFRTKELNLALGKPVEGTFVARPDNHIAKTPSIISRVTDGSTSYFKGMATSGNITRAAQWVQIDLQESHAINLITIDWRQNAHSRDYMLEGSLDNNTFFPIAEHLDATAISVRTTSETGDPVLKSTIVCKGKKIRYIKVSLAKGSKFYNKHAGRQNFVQIMELKVYPVISYQFNPILKEVSVESTTP